MSVSDKISLFFFRVSVEFFMGFMGMFIIHGNWKKAVLIGCVVIVLIEVCLLVSRFVTKAVEGSVESE